MLDIEKLMRGIEDYVARALKPLAERIKTLEARTPEKGDKGDKGDKGEPGEPGKAGTSITIDDVKGLVVEEFERFMPDMVTQAVSKHAAQQDDSVTDALAARIKTLEARTPEKGDKGEPGEPGKAGTSITIDDVKDYLAAEIERRSAQWQLDFERRAYDHVTQVIERMPVPKDGRDALDLDDMTVEHDGDGTVNFTFRRGALEKSFSLRLPRFKDMGVYSATKEKDYRAGDGVSFRGSFFIAQTDAPQGNPEESKSWRLAVKRGRDGRDVAEKQAEKKPYKLHGGQ